MNVKLGQFNRGIISPLALARTDLNRTQFSAETMINWIPRVLGSMMLRPGLKYIGSSASDAQANFLEHVFSTDDKSLVEVTNTAIRVWVDEVVITRPSVSTAVTNGSFDTDLTGWTDSDESGGTSAWVTGGYLGLTGNGTAAAVRTQTLTVAAGDQNVEHALRIVIQRGPVVFRAGSSSGAEDYIDETVLGTGTHSLAFTPTGASVFIRFESRLKRQVLVDSCTVESSGVMSVTAPWLTADLDNIRFDQSGDILYVACNGYQQRKIERRTARSWSVVLYQPEDGPFRVINAGPITLTAAALSGNTTLTASAALFNSDHVGALFKLTSVGQAVSASISAQNTFSNTISVTGTSTARSFSISLTGTWSATVTLQRSFDDGSSWIDVTTYTANTTTTYTDGLDNQIILYRIGVKTGAYTSGTVEASLSITTGSITGVGRVTGYTSTTVVDVEVIEDFGGTTATELWYEGEWSTFRGFPTSVAFVEGRLAWAGRDGVQISVSDGFESFDDETEGDSAPISRTIGSGPVDTINWILPLQRLLLGSEGAEFVCKSSSQDEPITADNFTVKPASTQGSSNVEAQKLDKLGIYVQRGGTRVMQISIEDDSEYGSSDLTVLCPEVTSAGVKRMAIQRQPDTRIHCVLDDGTVAIAIFDRLENVLCWVKFETDGEVEDVCILPGDEGDTEDMVYYHVQRVGGTTGSDLVTNGSFTSDLSSWTITNSGTGDTSWSSGQALMSDTFIGTGAPSTTMDQTITTVNGTTYRVEFDTTIITNGVTVRVGSTSGGAELYAATVYSSVVTDNGFTFTATGTSSYLRFSASGVGMREAIDNVSCTAVSSTIRTLERWALESDCIGATLNKQADSYIEYSGSSTTTITGLSHLNGRTVVVWGGGKSLGSYAVSGGQITGLSEAVTSAIVGLSYTAQWKSTKLSYASGSGLLQKKRIPMLGVVLKDTHYQGLEFGPDFNTLDPLPAMENMTSVPSDTVHSSYDEEPFTFPGTWNTDARLCLKATAPKPCTILAAVIGIEVHEKN